MQLLFYSPKYFAHIIEYLSIHLHTRAEMQSNQTQLSLCYALIKLYLPLHRREIGSHSAPHYTGKYYFNHIQAGQSACVKSNQSTYFLSSKLHVLRCTLLLLLYLRKIKDAASLLRPKIFLHTLNIFQEFSKS